MRGQAPLPATRTPRLSAEFLLPVAELKHTIPLFVRRGQTPKDARILAWLEHAHRDGVVVPPVSVWRGPGGWELANDGHHRLHVARGLGWQRIPAIELLNATEFFLIAHHPDHR